MHGCPSDLRALGVLTMDVGHVVSSLAGSGEELPFADL